MHPCRRERNSDAPLLTGNSRDAPKITGMHSATPHCDVVLASKPDAGYDPSRMLFVVRGLSVVSRIGIGFVLAKSRLLKARFLGRIKAHIPERQLSNLLIARSLFGDGPAIGLPHVRSVLVIAPHPDDEILGCGGTLVQLAEEQTRITVFVATDGEATRGSVHSPKETRRRRRAETRAGCAVLGVDDVTKAIVSK